MKNFVSSGNHRRLVASKEIILENNLRRLSVPTSSPQAFTSEPELLNSF